MRDDQDLIPAPLTAAAVRSYIDFDGHEHTSPGQLSLQARLQSEGVAALWQLLETNGFAYLADEVGMGKTRETMGVIATQFLRKPDSRVVIVCSSEMLQRQWQSEWAAFLQTCYKLLEDRLLSSVDASQLEILHKHETLREFMASLRRGEARIHLLRYSSFSWPVSLGDTDDLDAMLARYARGAGLAGPDELNAAEREIVERLGKPAEDRPQALTRALAEPWCERLGALLAPAVQGGASGDGAHEPLDLVIFDEAQYLRHVDNHRNRNIARVFRGRVGKWLFVSGTPLHSGDHDIRSLDSYLCRKLSAADTAEGAREVPYPRACGGCEHGGRCSRIAAQLEVKTDVVTVLKQIMVRRTRTYADGKDKRYGKIQYRHYERVRYSGADDPFYALTMALVQKRLVGTLAGRNNTFRQGECASFESLSASVGRLVSRKRPTGRESLRDFEAGTDGRNDDEPGVAVDRTVIDELNRGFVRAMTVSGDASGLALPHAKLNDTVDTLFERSLRDGSVDKTLVFVRRIDSVEEIRDLLHARFQQEVDARLDGWRTLLQRADFSALGASPWAPGSFWAIGADPRDNESDDEKVEGEEEGDEGDDVGVTDEPRRAGHFRERLGLPYFEAVRRGSGDNPVNGKLVSFAGRLLAVQDPKRNPLRGFLLKRPDVIDADAAVEPLWQRNQQRWGAFLAAVLGEGHVATLRNDPATRDWLFADTRLDSDNAWKLAALQRCLLESMRHSDFLVDLYILNTHLSSTPDGETELPEKLCWLLNHAGAWGVPRLATYIANWNARFRRWIEHFDLIVNKCFRAGKAAGWREICSERVKQAFLSMAPVVGRSGRIENIYAATQFNFPVHPNVLVCTDVLKEGVDMHLFCDQIMHYGVAWTSGDLEQRIGRIDRLGSLVGRRIERYRHDPQDGAAALPQLDVKFPYLDATLDRYQVDRVIRSKLISDLRMDLGKRKDDIGDLDVDSLAIEASVHVASDTQEDPPRAVFFPDEVKFVRDDDADRQFAWPAGVSLKSPGQHVSPWRPDEAAPSSETPLPAWMTTRIVRRVVPRSGRGSPLLRITCEAGRQAALLLSEEILVSNPGDGTASVARALDDAGPAGVLKMAGMDDSGFVASEQANTLIWRDAASTGSAREAGRASGRVSLEAIGDAFWLLRTAVCASEAARRMPGHKSIESWLAAQNRERRWGYLASDGRLVWFCVVVRAAGGAERPLLARLAKQVLQVARFYRSPIPGARDGEPAYRSPSAFPSAASAGAMLARGTGLFDTGASDTTTSKGMADMKHEDLVVCGQLLSGVHSWFSEAFDAVLSALYEDEGDRSARRLVPTPLEFLDGGLLRIGTEGAEHFRLHAWLDLAGTLNGDGIPAGPKMVWELAASPISRGKPPVLPVSELHELPHATAGAWQGEIAGQCSVHTWRGEKYRYLTVYHTPQAWDSARDPLLAAWQAVLAWMQTSASFQMKSCRDAFFGALEEARAEA
ncbi:C-terminal helicase domain-containing protein [Burkholderia vietnamiensis]|uniref:C-terminal helicase domain-containing protein n=1 Tax=Burkholderia vietnamiensis TaxID=60552 RepID=UPI001594AE5D|nr:DEAD/DEAH box helicase [Burkholderia vietnamiensis]